MVKDGRGQPLVVPRWLPWLVLAVGLAGEAVVLIVQDRRLWFFRDDFAFMLARPIGTALAPHSGHWSTLPLIAFRVMWHVFGLRYYLPYALMPLLLHLALAVCLAVLVRRAGVGVWPAVLTGLVFAYLGGGAGAENPLWAFQIGFIGSALAGFLAVLCFHLALAHREDRWGRRWFWIGEACLVASLMCSGLGVPMVVTAASWALFRSGPAAALRTAALPAVVFAVWFAVWGRTGSFHSPPADVGLSRGPLAAAKGIGNIWTAATTVPGAGPAVLLVLVAAVIWIRHERPLFALGAAGLVGLAVEYLILGFGRSGAGFDQVLHSRYLYVGLALSAPAMACMLELIARWMRNLAPARVGVWVLAAVLVVVVGSGATSRYADDRRATDPARKQELLAAAVLIRSGVRCSATALIPSTHPASRRCPSRT